jgi:hypothetical protein
VETPRPQRGIPGMGGTEVRKTDVNALLNPGKGLRLSE